MTKLHLKSNQGSGSPLLYLHGVTRNHRDLWPLFGELAGGWHTVGLDARGHGLSDRAASYLVSDYVQDACEIVMREFEEPVILFGHSLGAMVALSIAARHPDRIRAVIAEDPPFETLGSRIGETHFQAYFRALYELLESHEDLANRLAEVRIGAARLGDTRPFAATKFHAECLARLDRSVLLPIVAGNWLDGHPWHEELARIECPVLLLAGNPLLGGMLPRPEAEDIQKQIRQCDLVVLEESGHQIHASHPEDLLRRLHEFLNKHIQ